MSAIESRNYQLRLIYDDKDLAKPAHDDIMIWLEKFVRDPSNWPKLIPTQFQVFWKISENYILQQDGLPKRISDYEYQYRDLKKEFPEEKIKMPIDENVPPRRSRFWRLDWEVPLYDFSTHGGRGARLGFIDMRVDFSSQLEAQYVTKRFFRYDSKASPRHQLAETTETWQLQDGAKTLLFEVKTEIKTIGELLRQLKLYQSSATVRELQPKIFVVAPQHDEAERVLKDHGIGFIPYVI